MMKLRIFILAITLTRRPAWAAAAPAPVTFLDDAVYIADKVWYAGDHDIVEIHLSLRNDKFKIFFVEADIANNSYKGLYALDFAHDKKTVKKILENGKCITSDDEAAYFGATDGVYRYNFTDNSVAKYGSVTADVKDIEKKGGDDLIYVVTEDNRLQRVTDRGNTITEHEVLANVERIAMDEDGNLYFYEKHDDDDDHVPFYEKYTRPRILTGDRILDVSGLPDKYTSIALGTGPFREGAVVILDHNIYQIRANGISRDIRYMFLDNPSAFSFEPGLLQLYGYDKKLYCYSVLEKLDLSGLGLEGAMAGVAEAFRYFNFTTKS